MCDLIDWCTLSDKGVKCETYIRRQIVFLGQQNFSPKGVFINLITEGHFIKTYSHLLYEVVRTAV